MVKQVEVRILTPPGAQDEVVSIIERAMQAHGWSPVERSRPYPSRREPQKVRLYLTFAR